MLHSISVISDIDPEFLFSSHSLAQVIDDAQEF
jgi:hypothetical protein